MTLIIEILYGFWWSKWFVDDKDGGKESRRTFFKFLDMATSIYVRSIDEENFLQYVIRPSPSCKMLAIHFALL